MPIFKRKFLSWHNLQSDVRNLASTSRRPESEVEFHFRESDSLLCENESWGEKLGALESGEIFGYNRVEIQVLLSPTGFHAVIFRRFFTDLTQGFRTWHKLTTRWKASRGVYLSGKPHRKNHVIKNSEGRSSC